MKTLLVFAITSLFCIANANQNVATIVRIKGDVSIFTHPGNKILGPAPRVLFEKTYYSVKKAKLGEKLLNGHIIQTGKSSKARVIFKNGDQIYIGEGTAYKINWKAQEGTNKNRSVLNLIRGQFRAIISKKGPRNNLMIKSKQASLAIRGTDFYVKKVRNSIQLSVVRGRVNVTAANETKMVETGNSAIARKKVRVYQTSKKELVNIHKSSIIKIEKTSRPQVTKETAKELVALENQAVSTTLADIKEYNPEQFKKLAHQNIQSVSSLNVMVIKDSFEKAPKDRAIKIDEFNEEEPYRKYFKIED